MISASASGSTSNMERFLAKAQQPRNIENAIRSVAEAGVHALSQATPIESGETAAQWSYEIETKGNGDFAIHWINKHQHEGQYIAVLIQYGHGTGTGGYVQGRDYINPAMRPIFDQIANNAWKAVNS